MSAAYMKSQLLEYFFDSKNNRFRPLKGIQKYFGTKTAFVIGFESLYTNWLVAPTVAGAAAFGVSSRPSTTPRLTTQKIRTPGSRTSTTTP